VPFPDKRTIFAEFTPIGVGTPPSDGLKRFRDFSVERSKTDLLLAPSDQSPASG
jgi:hypothetical protein